MWHCGTSERRKVYPFQLSIQREGTISELSVLVDVQIDRKIAIR